MAPGDEGIHTLGRRHPVLPYHGHTHRVGLTGNDDIVLTYPRPRGKLPPAPLDMRGSIACIVTDIETVIGARRGTHVATHGIESPDTLGIKKRMIYILH